MTTIPNKWVILKITTVEPVIYRVFGMWRGGYLSGDSWRVNSGIDRVEETDDSYLFYGRSGSVYDCAKRAYGLTAYGSAVLCQWLAGGVQIMPEDTDWMTLLENTTEPHESTSPD
jgi:hypothetical protein